MTKHNWYVVTEEMKRNIEKINETVSDWREAIAWTVDVIFKEIPEEIDVDYERYLRDRNNEKIHICTC
jgi:hypothetical protein